MTILNNLINKYSGLQTVFKSFFLVVILFLVFFAVNVFISLKSKTDSAYTVLNNNEKLKLMLQDTRVHNWSELEKKN